MDLSTFSGAFAWVQTHGYAFIFLVMFFEGPLITTAAAFAASLGYFNIWIIFLLAMLGDISGDLFHYWIGRQLDRKHILKWGGFLGVTKETFHMERQLKEHPARTILIVKQIPPLTSAGLVMAGTFRVPLRDFIGYSALFTLPRAIFFTSLGYFFGVAAEKVLAYFSLGEYWAIALVIAIAIIYFIFRFVSKRVARKLEE